MTDIGEIRNKVQRILTNNFSVRLDNEGDFIVDYESANCWVEVRDLELFDKKVGQISFVCPMVRDVRLTPEVFKWVALEGHDFRFGSAVCYEDDNGSTGSLFFEYSMIGVDVDESEVVNAVMFLLLVCSDLDTELQQKFGGRLFGED
jgi:hypothetical protein